MLFLILLLGVSCCNRPKPSVKEIEYVNDLFITDSIDIESLGILNPYNISYHHDMLVFKSKGKNGLQVLDLRDYKTYSINIIGEGPDEVSMFSIVKNNHSSLLHFTDPNTRKILAFNVDTLRLDADAKPYFWMKMPIDKNEVIFNSFENQSFFFFSGHIDNGRFLNYNKKTGESIASGTFPENEQTESLDWKRKGSVFNGTVLTGNDTHVAVCCNGLLNFYEIMPEGSLKEINHRYYYFPTFYLNNGNGAVITFSNEDIVGFRDIASEGDNVYMLYSDKTVKKNGEGAFNCESIIVYDWQGNAKCEYRLEKSLYSFALDGKRVYGICREDNPKVYIYQLP